MILIVEGKTEFRKYEKNDLQFLLNDVFSECGVYKKSITLSLHDGILRVFGFLYIYGKDIRIISYMDSIINNWGLTAMLNDDPNYDISELDEDYIIEPWVEGYKYNEF